MRPRTTIFTLLICVLSIMKAAVPSSSDKERMKPVRPDMDKIAAEVADPKSKYYYPKLMARYEANETIMGLEDYRHLYLGYVFQEDYNPYRHSEFAQQVEEQYYKTDHTRAECDTIIKYAELSLDRKSTRLNSSHM